MLAASWQRISGPAQASGRAVRASDSRVVQLVFGIDAAVPDVGGCVFRALTLQ
jgi:hypothetical protein